MAETNRTEPSYASRPVGNHVSKGKDQDVEKLWKKVARKGPLFDFQQFEHALKDLKLQGNDREYVNEVRKVFMDELQSVKAFSEKFARKIVSKIGHMNVTDGQVLEYVSKQGKKKGLESRVINAISREVCHMLSDNPSRAPYFRFNTSNATKVGDGLAVFGVDQYDHFKNQSHPTIEKLAALSNETSLLHAHVLAQTLPYTDCAIEAVTGTWDPTKDNKYSHIHPVLAALYMPKIPIIEDHTLLASISNIVLTRSRNEPIALRPDYQLFYNMVHDKNESVCDNKDALKDLQHRAEIQAALWSAVLALREGRYYDESGMKLLNKLNMCRYYCYEAADIVYSGDEGDIARRILMTFSLRPIQIKTLISVPASSVSLTTPFLNMQLQNGEIDTVPMVNIRLSLYETSGPVAAIENVLRSREFFWDKLSHTHVPKFTQIMDTNNLLIVYIHRRQMVIPLTRMQGPLTFRDLPQTSKEYFNINTNPVRVDRMIQIGEASGQWYNLRSAVCLKSMVYTDSHGDQRIMPHGSETFILPVDAEMSPLVYDPCGVGKRNDGTVTPPIEAQVWDDGSDDCLKARIANKGVLLVFTKVE
jgi:hypothetical protein